MSGGFWNLPWVSERERRLLKFNVSEWVSRSLTHSRSLTLTHSWVFRTAAGEPFDSKETATDSHSRSKIYQGCKNRIFFACACEFFLPRTRACVREIFECVRKISHACFFSHTCFFARVFFLARFFFSHACFFRTRVFLSRYSSHVKSSLVKSSLVKSCQI